MQIVNSPKCESPETQENKGFSLESLEKASKIRVMKVLILGGGFGGVYTFRNLHKLVHGQPNLEIRIISRTNYFLFTPLLHEVATGGVAEDNVIYNLRSMFPCCLKDVVVGEVQSIETATRQVQTDKGAFAYDVLLYALGGETNYYKLQVDNNPHVVALKTLDDAKALKNKVIDIFDDGRTPSFVIAGGGPTGVEVAAELKEMLNDLAKEFPSVSPASISLSIIHGGDRLLPAFSPQLGQEAQAVLEKRGITILLQEMITNIDGAKISLASGKELEAQLIVWTAGIKPHIVPFLPTPPPLDKQGRVQVTPFLNLADHPEIFFVGDAAGVVGVPMTAQAATEGAKIAAKNIAATIIHQPLQEFRYFHRGDLFSLGQWMAGAELYGQRFFGHLAWWIWRTVYLSKLISLRDKLRVMVDWTLDLFEPRDLNRF